MKWGADDQGGDLGGMPNTYILVWVFGLFLFFCFSNCKNKALGLIIAIGG